MVDGEVQQLDAPPGLEESWEEFLNGGRPASEVQLWNPEELWVSLPEQQRFGGHSFEPEDWEQRLGASWRSRARGRGAGRGRRGRGRGYGGRRLSWHESSVDRRLQGVKRYVFN